LKKRSAAKTPKSPLESFTFLVEESLGKRLARALVEQGLTAITHVDNPDLPRGINDEQWAKETGEAGWVVLSKDLETRYKPNEREAIVRYKARVIQFTRGNWTGDQMTAAFTLAKKRVEKLLNKQPGPFIARISKKGEITRVFTELDLSGPAPIAPDGSSGNPTDDA
jgi:hypothetical protein